MSFLKNSFYSIANKIFNILFTFLILIVIARTLGPEGQGEYSLLVQFAKTVYYFLSFGIPVAFIFFFGRKPQSRPSLVKSFTIVFIVLSLFSFFITLKLGEINIFDIFSSIESPAIVAACIGVPLWFANSYISTLFAANEDFRRQNKIQLIQPTVLFLSVTVLFLYEKLSTFTAIYAYNLSLAISFMMGTLTVLRIGYFKNVLKAKHEIPLLTKGTKYAFKGYVSNVSQFLMYKADIFLIAHFLPKSALGLYVIAINIVERLWLLSEAVSHVLFSKLVNTKTEEKSSFFAIYTLKVNFLISAIGSILLLIFVQVFLKLFFGEEFMESKIYVFLLLPGVILQSGSLMIKKILEARGYPGANAISSSACLVLNIVLNLILIPRFGLKGAALSTSLSYTIYFLIQSRTLSKKFGIKKRQYLITTPSDLKYLVSNFLLPLLKRK